MATTGYKRTLLTGGTSDALDSVDGATLSEDDFAFVLKDGELYFYNYKDYGTPQGESSPDIIVPDTNPGNFAWELQNPISFTVIDTNTTLYLATTGNDTTGDGSSGTPWYSLEKAFDYLKDKWINDDITVTISIGDGTYTGFTPFTISHPCANNIEISGFAEATTILTFTDDAGITIVGTTLALLEKCTLKGAAINAGNYALILNYAKVTEIFNVKFDTWYAGIYADMNSFAYVNTCDFYNFRWGIFADQSRIKVDATDFDANSVSISVGCWSYVNSEIITVASVTFANMSSGCFCRYNSFIDATGVSSNTATTPYDPAATTSSSAEPTWDNWGSWIKD